MNRQKKGRETDRRSSPRSGENGIGDRFYNEIVNWTSSKDMYTNKPRTGTLLNMGDRHFGKYQDVNNNNNNSNNNNDTTLIKELGIWRQSIYPVTKITEEAERDKSCVDISFQQELNFSIKDGRGRKEMEKNSGLLFAINVYFHNSDPNSLLGIHQMGTQSDGSPPEHICIVDSPRCMLNHKLCRQCASPAVSERAMSPDECMSWYLCSLVLHESHVLLRVEKKKTPFIFSPLLFGFYSNWYCDRAAIKRNINEARKQTLLTKIVRIIKISPKTHSTTSSDMRGLIEDDYDY
ncbi:hypothetical protein STEG23_004145 [Scotinomys teguina]